MSIRDNLGGGSAAANVLDTIEEIEANTDPGKPAGALAVKEYMGGVRFGKDGEGNVGYFGDDDILIPFKRVAKGSFTITNSLQTIEVGFRPKYLLLSTLGIENNAHVPSFIYEYDEEYSTENMRRLAVASSNSASSNNLMPIEDYLQIHDNGFSTKSLANNYSNRIAHYIAVG